MTMPEPEQQPAYPVEPAQPAQPAYPEYPQQGQQFPYPAQPYPAHPYPAQPYPAQPYPAQPYPAQPSAPSGVTAVFAAVLGLIGAVITAGIVAINVGSVIPHDGFSAETVTSTVAPGFTAIALLVGCIALLRRRSWGSVLIAAGCAVLMLYGAVDPFLSTDNSPGEMDTPLLVVMLVIWIPIMFVMPLVTLVLALVPSTRRWCAARG